MDYCSEKPKKKKFRQCADLTKNIIMNIKHLACTMAIGLLHLSAQANSAIFSNQASFLSATGATSATGVLPDLPGQYTSVQIGSVTLTDVSGRNFYVGGLVGYPQNDWTTLLPGNEIAINSVENLDVSFKSLVYAAGFDFAEPGSGSTSSPYANNAYYPYADSEFTVTLKNNGTFVSAFTFNAPDEVASFVGVWSDAAFNRMEIRETTGGIEDEYFGQFYTGNVALVPEPEAWAMLLIGLGLVGLKLRRTESEFLNS